MKTLKQKTLGEIESNSDLFDDINVLETQKSDGDDLGEADKLFQYDTEDAGLIYLANRIDDGIKARIDFNDSPGAKTIRKWYNRLYPLQILILCTYVAMTAFETPSWCLEKMHAIETQV